jgi:hypothetical protein
MNNNEYSIIMTLELLPQGNLDSSRGDNQGILKMTNKKTILNFHTCQYIGFYGKRFSK